MLTGTGTSHRTRLVLRWLAAGPCDDLRELLRPDILDLVSLNHPSLALACQFGRDPENARPFLLRPYVDGMDCEAALRGKPVADLLPWLHASGTALGLLHRFGFLHRNLATANLLIPKRALFARRIRGPRIVLVDPAWWPETTARPNGTRPVAPELHAPDSPPTVASDLYALGVVFHRLLTGGELRPGPDGIPGRLSKLNPDIPIDLERLVMKLLHPDPSRRYQSADDLLADLRVIGQLNDTECLAVPECFLGRRNEIERATRALEDRSRPVALAVTGEAGTGKSAFLRRLTLEAQVLGYRTMSARCYAENALAFAPLQTLADQLTDVSAARSSLRRRFRDLLGGMEPGADPAARTRFLRGLADFFNAAAAPHPTLLIIDEVHVATPLTIAFLVDLAKDIAALQQHLPDRRRNALSLVVSFRTESPFREILAPLVDTLGRPLGGHLVIELDPLQPAVVESWLHLARGERPVADSTEKIPVELRGNPFAIRESLHGDATSAGSSPAGNDLASLYLDDLESLTAEQRHLLAVLAVLGHPASMDLLGEVGEARGSRLRKVVEPLLQKEIIVEERGQLFFRHDSFQNWLGRTLGERETKELHRRIAGVLQGRRGESTEEIAHHWMRSDTPEAGISIALEAARRLARLHEDRHALRLYETILDLLPSPWDEIGRSVAEEASNLYTRTGEFRRGVELLEKLLENAPAEEEGHLRARMGYFYHLAGDATRATVQLEKGLSLLMKQRGVDAFRDRMRVESELAEIACNRGDYLLAETICQRALQHLAHGGGSREDSGIRREEMALLETLANLRLRRFQYDEARELFERGLRIGNVLGDIPEKSLILNNIGVLHNQENRYPRAIECYEGARKVATRFGQDSMLVSIESNLAILHAKTGDPDAADESMRRAIFHDSRCDSNLTRFLRFHAAGTVDLLLGRFASAIESFKEALVIGEELKDYHMLAFDLVYLGECHLHRGEFRPCHAALDRALSVGSAAPPPVVAMVAARKAVLGALRGDSADLEKAIEKVRENTGVPYLRGWNQFYLGWALRLLGQRDRAHRYLEEAREFFIRIKAPPGEIHAQLELSGLEADAGKAGRARKRLRALRSKYDSGSGVLRNPMLAARLLAYETRCLLENEEPDLPGAAALLVEAESCLIGHRLGDLENLTRELRRRIHELSLERQHATSPLAGPIGDGATVAGVLEMTESIRAATVELVRNLAHEVGEERVADVRRQLDSYEDHMRAVRRALEDRRPVESEPVTTRSIVGRSPAVRSLIDGIRRVVNSSLSVLITGETGTGKELVARAIHGEGPRSTSPFLSVNCAALPEQLLEAELFGYVKGAFTGAERDHEGLLVGAQGGVFLFDEIGEMPLSSQGKLLRLLDRNRVRPLGSADEVAVDVRYLFATNRDLQALVDEGTFREDLFFRIKTIELEVPPLRERIEDLQPLMTHFQNIAGLQDERPKVEAAALRALAAYPWPGNVREFQNVTLHLLLTCRENVTAGDVKRLLGKPSSRGLFSAALLRSRPLEQLVFQLEREYLLQVFHDHSGNLDAIAAMLGITRRALYKRFQRLEINPGRLK